jgi:hypothetical protein
MSRTARLKIILSHLLPGLAASGMLLSVRYVAFSPLGQMNFFEVGVCLFCGLLLGRRAHELMQVLYGRRIVKPAYAAQMIVYGLFLRIVTAMNSPDPARALGVLKLTAYDVAALQAGGLISYVVIAGGVVLGLHSLLRVGEGPAETALAVEDARVPAVRL